VQSSTRKSRAALLLAFLLAAAPASALWGAIDDAPAATLLVPYFEVTSAPRRESITTRFSVTNLDASAIVAHATLWTDFGLPTVNFNIELEAGATLEVDLADLFHDGELPFPAFGDTPCAGLSSSAPFTARELFAAHTGEASAVFADECGAISFEDSIARGFVTIDVVNDCTDLTPYTEAYFMSHATEDNVLTGSYAIEHTSPASVVAAPAVHLEANSSFVGLETFYHRFGPVDTTIDGREPLLVEEWTAAYNNELTELVCWRDLLLNDPFPCGGGILIQFPSITVRDHDGEEDLVDILHTLCTSATGKVRVGDATLDANSKSGSISIRPNVAAVPSGGSTPLRQTWVAAIHTLHPLGLAVHVPAVATQRIVALPLVTSGTSGGGKTP